MEAYAFDQALKAIREFAWNILADEYIELVKGRLYSEEPERESATAALSITLDALIRMLAPFVPHFAEECYHHLKGRSVHREPWVEFGFRDAAAGEKGDLLAEISGSLASILTAERVALNLFQRMCGIATLTRRYVDQIEGMPAKILDTRKTVPGLRILDKYAVRVGGGYNHRFALYDGVLIKDNHIKAAGGIGPAVRRVRERIPHTLKIEVEVKNLTELEEALAAGADAVMLDNMELAEMAAAVKRVGGMIPLEASGNMTLERVREVAATGVDLISVGALTHSVAAADISLNVIQVESRPS